MFKKAVANHEAANAVDKSLAQQIFPSSSPPVPPQNTLKSYHHFSRPATRPLSNGSANIQKPNHIKSSSREPPTTKGIKRTSSGLEKALDGRGDFENDQRSKGNSQENLHIIQDDSPIKKGGVGVTATAVYFDENDFDSDIDLDVEDPATKGTISYPKLPSVPPAMSKPMLEPTKPRKAPVETQNWGTRVDSGYVSEISPAYEAPCPPFQHIDSSEPLPWSSSPVEHLKTPAKPPALRQFAYNGGETREDKLRPTKRRTLPWLQQQLKEEGELLTYQKASEMSALSRRPAKTSDSCASQSTPLPKSSKESLHPWNTTASAVKEQQKKLRQANKKSTGGAADKQLAETFRKRSSAVSRLVFLSDEQQHVLNLVVEQKRSVFFTGSAGTGKSVLLREIIAGLRRKYTREPDRVAVTASTGLAACNIGGVTLHSFAGIGLGKEPVEDLVKKIKKNQKAKHRWMRTKVLIVDEISMVDGELFDKLEHIARSIRNNGRPFGGIQLVITGDFFQLPPVPENGRAARFAFDAGTWSTSIEHTIGLHHVFRQKDPVFANMLNEMREGRLTAASIAKFRSLSRDAQFDDELGATELFPTRAEVDRANNLRMGRLHGDVRVFEARDGGTISDPAHRTKLLANCMAPERVELKKGAQVMLIKNVDDTLVNGSLGIVVGFMSEQTFDTYHADEEAFYAAQDGKEEDLNPAERKLKNRIDLLAATAQTYPVVRFTLADGTTRDLLCQREVWKVELPNGEVQASRSQVPLILAWALSIHKAQGQTLERVKVDLGKVFEKGQAYVALSRATSMAGLQILNFDPKKVIAHEKVRAFYASLSRAEYAAGGNTSKQRKLGVTADGYEPGFVGQDLDDEEQALMESY